VLREVTNLSKKLQVNFFEQYFGLRFI